MNTLRVLSSVLLGVGLMLITAGCPTVSGPQPPEVLPGLGSQSTSDPTGLVSRQVDPQVGPHPELPPELQEAIAKLNVQVVVAADENLSGGEFERAVRARLSTAGFTIIPTEPPELQVEVSLESELFDQSGNYYLYRGTATAELQRCIDRKQLAGDSFTVKGERKLGQRAAVVNLRDQLATKVDQWTSANVMPNRVGVAAAELTLSLSRCKLVKGYDQEEIARFMQSVQSIPGVVSCRLIHNDPQQRVYRFRVIYYPEKVPMGLSNAAALSLGYRSR